MTLIQEDEKVMPNSVVFNQLAKMLHLLHPLGLNYQVKLGIFLRSLTDSRKLIKILNRYEHCANYHAVEDIETELTFNAIKAETEIPNAISACNKGGIGCAFDNLSRFLVSQSGKDTLHKTVGTSYE